MSFRLVSQLLVVEHEAVKRARDKKKRKRKEHQHWQDHVRTGAPTRKSFRSERGDPYTRLKGQGGILLPLETMLDHNRRQANGHVQLSGGRPILWNAKDELVEEHRLRQIFLRGVTGPKFFPFSRTNMSAK
jgi:hypothetical protein